MWETQQNIEKKTPTIWGWFTAPIKNGEILWMGQRNPAPPGMKACK